MPASLDLPPQFGDVGLQSMIRAADEELLGSWASITSDMITFFRSKDLPVYAKLANALDAMTDSPDDPTYVPHIPTIERMLAVVVMAHAFLDDIPRIEIDFTTYLLIGERNGTIPSRYSLLEATTRPDPHRAPRSMHSDILQLSTV